MKSLSLIQRMWLLLLLLVFLSLGGAWLANLYNARNYLEQQLASQNANTANSLALMITQHRAEPAMAELLINASFDQGSYHAIRWRGPDGQPRLERAAPSRPDATPAWFRRLLPLAPAPGRALINAGWLQAGQLEVEAELGFAYDSLWRGAWHASLYLLAAGLLVGLLGSIDIFKLRRELGQMVEQARAISERRFIQIAEPPTPELSRVARALNHMVERLQAYLGKLSAEVEQLRQANRSDAVTGLANRETLEQALSAQLADDDASGYLLLLRLANLAELNQRLGGAAADQLLRRLAADLERESAACQGWLAARLRGADFALLCPQLEPEDAARLAERLSQQLALYPQMGLSDQTAAGHLGVAAFGQGDEALTVLARANQALAQAEAAGPNQWRLDDGAQLPAHNDRDWRQLLEDSCRQQQLALRWYQVADTARQPLWQEAMLYRPAVGEQAAIPALRLVSHALRLGLTATLDLAALQLALQHAPSAAIAVNLSPASLAAADFLPGTLQLLQGSRHRVAFEFDETGLPEHWPAFLAFGRAVKAAGHRLAVEIRGHRLELVARLHEAGIDYLVLDGVLTRGIHRDEGRQVLLRGLQRMTSLMGVELVAKGVACDDDCRVLIELGVDGLTGPAVS